MLWRHGDVLIASIESIPAQAARLPHLTLAHGEITGHSHRVSETDAAVLWQSRGQLYLQVIAATATLVHEEHHAITLPAGSYRVWQQREYTPQAIRVVRD